MFSDFMINTWIVGTIVAVTAGIVGFFVVVCGASFAAHALPLSAFPGAAAAALFGVNELLGIVVFAALGVAGIGTLGRRGRPEVATALTLVMLLGLGTLFLSMTRAYSQQVYALLFGQVLGIGNNDVIAVAAVSLLAVTAIGLSFRPLMLSAVSPDLADARGLASGGIDLWFLAILALAASVALPVVGALMVFSLMVGPASAARNLAARPETALCLSVAIAVATVWAAVALAYVTDWPVGFFVGVLGALAYATGRIARWNYA